MFPENVRAELRRLLRLLERRASKVLRKGSLHTEEINAARASLEKFQGVEDIVQRRIKLFEEDIKELNARCVDINQTIRYVHYVFQKTKPTVFKILYIIAVVTSRRSLYRTFTLIL